MKAAAITSLAMALAFVWVAGFLGQAGLGSLAISAAVSAVICGISGVILGIVAVTNDYPSSGGSSVP